MVSITNTRVGSDRTRRPRPRTWQATASATGDPAYTDVLPRTAETAGVARHMVRACLDVWHLAQLADAATLVVTELVANAVEHARGDSIRLTVTRTAGHRVRIAVVDRSRVLPKPRCVGGEDEAGRGLYLVDGMTEKWGVDDLSFGKRVWAELEAST